MDDSKATVARGPSSTELALVFPILPGMVEEVEHLAAELSGPRAAEFHRSQHTLGVRKESWFLNRSPTGDFVTVYIEAADVLNLLGKLVASDAPIDRWLKAEVQRVTGIDFGKPSQLSLPQQVLRYPA
jgi:hypothetical protein